MNYNSTKICGHDYSRPFVEILPEVIGKRSKSIPEIATAAGRTQATVKKVVKRLHCAGQIHIKRWKRDRPSGPYVAYYFWGQGKDAKRPAPQPRSEILKRYQASQKGKDRLNAWRKSDRGQEYRENYGKAFRAREKFSKGGLAAIDPLLAAVMGQRNQPKKEL